jgi:D-3-phosphoglycerate dehydrogenase
LRVLIADRIDRAGLGPLADDERFDVVEQVGLVGDELAHAISLSDAVLVRSATRITREALAQAQHLQVIGRAGVGIDTIDVEAATEKGIAVLNAPAGNTVSATELTFSLILALVRKIPMADRSMKDGAWDRGRFQGAELAGKTLGLVGAGRVGTEVARRARAFDMHVLVYDPYLNEERARAMELELVSLEEVLRAADIVSLHVPLTDSTAGMLGGPQLALMKQGAYLVNAARGGVVDEAALLHALEDGRLAGAAFDVYDVEPLAADHPLRRLENVVLTPHLGASTEEAQRSVALEIATAVSAALLEGDLSRAVNAPAIGGEKMRRVRPLLDLSERLGRLARTLLDGPVQVVQIRYGGVEDDVLRPLAASALVGLLAQALGTSEVNFVNALHLAEARGIEVDWTRIRRHGAYAEFIELCVRRKGFETRVAGAMLGEGHPRVVRIGEYHVDIQPRGTLVVVRNRDVPGIIGRVGTFLGQAGLNIGGYHQARHDAGGEALAAIAIDSPLTRQQLAGLREIPEVLEIRQVDLGG